MRNIVQMVSMNTTPARIAVFCDDNTFWIYQPKDPHAALTGVGDTAWYWHQQPGIPGTEKPSETGLQPLG